MGGMMEQLDKNYDLVNQRVLLLQRIEKKKKVLKLKQ